MILCAYTCCQVRFFGLDLRIRSLLYLSYKHCLSSKSSLACACHITLSNVFPFMEWLLVDCMCPFYSIKYQEASFCLWYFRKINFGSTGEESSVKGATISFSQIWCAALFLNCLVVGSLSNTHTHSYSVCIEYFLLICGVIFDERTQNPNSYKSTFTLLVYSS